MPTDLQHFIHYARIFEVAHASGDFALLTPLFHEDIEHVVRPAALAGDHDRGRDAVIEGFRKGVLDYDRRFDARIPEMLEGPVARPDGVWMRFALGLRRSGLPELVVEGEHLTRFEDGRIRRIEETLAPDTDARVEAYMAEHAARLRPAGAPRTEPAPRDREDLETALSRVFVRVYGTSKVQKDVAAALDACSDDFVLENAAFGSRGVGREQVALQLAAFFHAFPDYSASMQLAVAPGHVVAWGDVRMSFLGELAGIAPTQKTIELPYVSIFDVAGGRLCREVFVIDRAGLCEQAGIAQAELVQAIGRANEALAK